MSSPWHLLGKAEPTMREPCWTRFSKRKRKFSGMLTRASSTCGNYRAAAAAIDCLDDRVQISRLLLILRFKRGDLLSSCGG
jgi:hypothetical protein